MIGYQKSLLGLTLLFRVHGSPLFRAAIPGFLSVVFLIILEHFWIIDDEDPNFDHPYGIGVLISSVSFLIIFRANYGYQRYWSACGDTHQMMSKWLDVAVHVGNFHLQQSHYDCIKPPNYYDNHDLNKMRLSRDREEEECFFSGSKREQKIFLQRRKKRKSIETPRKNPGSSAKKSSLGDVSRHSTGVIEDSKFLLSEGRLDGGWGSLFGDRSSTYHRMSSDPGDWNSGNDKGFASTHRGGRTPSLFLQELVHLTSLCNAVAFSTLRNDVDGSPSPLDMYHAGSDFPRADPDEHMREIERWTTIKYLFGFDRTPQSRTRYNASRPLPVLGGVSRNEIKFLQRAKGPSAKVALAHGWLTEFIIREDKAGSLGGVGAPIISRVMQFLSDGMTCYNQCRKIMFIPFPFPHAQLSAFFNVTMIFAVPLLMHEYSNRLWLSSVLTFMTVSCLAGLHEVARELENPFRNIPNDIPLTTLQAMFNESLITIYSGYHPDHYWNPNEYRTGPEINRISSSEKSEDEESYSRRSKAPLSPLRKAESSNTFSSLRNTETLASALDQEIAIFQLQKLVTKQSSEIERLSEILDIRHSPVKEVSFLPRRYVHDSEQFLQESKRSLILDASVDPKCF